jgi:hypothetical protein
VRVAVSEDGVQKPFQKVLTMEWKSLIFLSALDGVVAQLVEHHNGIVGVAGSIPVGSTIL